MTKINREGKSLKRLAIDDIVQDLIDKEFMNNNIVCSKCNCDFDYSYSQIIRRDIEYIGTSMKYYVECPSCKEPLNVLREQHSGLDCFERIDMSTLNLKEYEDFYEKAKCIYEKKKFKKNRLIKMFKRVSFCSVLSLIILLFLFYRFFI